MTRYHSLADPIWPDGTCSKKRITPLFVQQPPLLIYCSEVRRKITKRSSGLFEIGSHPPSASTATMATLPSLSLSSLCVEAKESEGLPT